MMSARLKSLELHGYKTFANRTVFEFSDSITAIVGPNGSGKSNIADSLRWVLGEQSYSLLRGKKTEDMIYSGSELRARAGMASATVTFENTDGWLPIDFSEVAITRRAYRDGENEYLINGQRMRLRDVQELLGNSGLGDRSYTIIGQGLVDAALSLKAEERRRLFEEAAGIGLHRSRREEALRRLDTTRRNLDRVKDILAELEPRLHSLERQARRAQEYNQVKSDLRVVLHDWYGYHWHKAQKELADARRVVRMQDSALEAARKEQVQLDERLKLLRLRVQELRHKLNGWHHQLSAFHTQREQLNINLAVTEEKQNSLALQRQGLEAEQLRLEEEIGIEQGRLAAIADDRSHLAAELSEAENQLKKSRDELAVAQEARLAADRRLQETTKRVIVATNSLSQLEGSVRESETQLQRDQKALAETQEEISASGKELQSLEMVFSTRKMELELAQAALHAADRESQAYQQVLVELENKVRQATNDREAVSAELASLKAELAVVQQAEAALTGYGSGTRLLIQASREQKIKGIRSILASELTVPAEFEVAISAILGETLQAVLLDENVDNALDLLLNKSTQGIVLPLPELAPEESDPLNLGMLQTDSDFIGRAVDLVEVTADLRPVTELVLGRAYLVRDRVAARRIITGIRSLEPGRMPNICLATLDGQVFYPNGAIHVRGAIHVGEGNASEGTQGILSRQRRQRELNGKINETQGDLDDILSQLGKLRQESVEAGAIKDNLALQLQGCRNEHQQASLALDKSRLAVEQAQRQFNWHQSRQENLVSEITRREAQRKQLAENLATLQQEIQQLQELSRQQTAQLAQTTTGDAQDRVAHWNTTVLVSQRTLNAAQQRAADGEQNIQKLTRQQQEVAKRLESLEITHKILAESIQNIQKDFHQVGEQITDLQSLIAPAESELEKFDLEQEQVQTAEAAARQVLNMAEHHSAQARIAQSRNLETLQSLRAKIEEDFGLVAFEYDEQVSGANPLPLEGMVDRLPVVAELTPEVEESLRRLQAQLRRIGPINPEAQEEYEEVQRRFGFMSEQINDLEKAETDVRQVIKELDTLMQQEFSITFAAVAEEFKSIFMRLFGGGTARLILSDPDDLTSTGIEIEARLPGRRTQGLVLLSGGERSLTATALIFALLKVSPTPFCLLDEVDAMLDEANVGRFRDLLSELSKRTQFIVVTHNRNTVQAAEVIYGVTMGRDSSSQVLSLKMDEVVEIG